MPAHEGKDKKGTYIQWGSQKKYYYHDKKTKAAAWKKAAAQGAAIKRAGYKGNNMLQRIKANFTGNIRHDEMMGRKYLVAPMIMLVEGVHDGSGGPLFYPEEELAKTPQIWNHKPVIVYHPQAGGLGISACDPIILSNRQVGVIMNTKFEDGKLKAEAWMEEDRMNKVDERISGFIEKNVMMELSTGLFTDNESADEGAKWNEEAYDAIARNYRPDHLALLPDLKGACSIEDGAGFLRLNAKSDKMVINANTLSHGNIRSMLNSWAHSRSEHSWVETVYDKSFIYEEEDNGRFYQREYEVKDNVVMVNDMTAVEVVRVTEWRTKDGNKFVGNKKETVSKENNNDSDRKGQVMDEKKKVKIIDALIACNTNSWGKDDRETLEAMEDAVLEKMLEGTIAAEKAVENAAKKGAEEATKKLTVNQDDTGDKEGNDNKQSAGESTEDDKGNTSTEEEKKATENKKPQTMAEFLANAPKELQGPLNSMLATHKAIKAGLIKKITDNEKNKFTKEELEAKDLPELRKLVAILPSDEQQDAELGLNFAGQGDVDDITDNKEEPMVMPAVILQEKKKS